MKRIFSVFLLLLVILGVNGCNREIKGYNNHDVSYREVFSGEDVIYNLSNNIKQINAISFEGNVLIDGNNFDISGKIVLNDTIESSVINVNVGKLSIYLKGNVIYISYLYNNTNVIVKDSVENFAREITNYLNNNGIECSEEKIMEFIKYVKIKEINFERLLKYVEKENLFLVKFKRGELTLNDRCLPSSFKLNMNKVEMNVNFTYESVKILIPIGYDLFVMNINDIKNLLGINNIGNLLIRG